LILSVWALAAKWDDAFAYSQEAMTDNYRLANTFEKLARVAPADIAMRFEIADAAYQARVDADNRQGLSDKDKRRGMRAALRQYQRPCVGCQKVPASMKPSECDICGNF
jgi:mobilome CxxCx(11)CxxC protein